ncbi:hypothetical protein ACI2K4_16330 [Micromonospora sp. NPDC050397]|uniref:hypothetical protein n=1 Tax=Micromonospora sp. NPDC050397 TaxID=3364279 RepID=UPI00384D6983
MGATAQVPLVGGVADGAVVTVELDGHGRPPLVHPHLGEGGLAQAQMYELESARDEGPPWVYRWRGPAT